MLNSIIKFFASNEAGSMDLDARTEGMPEDEIKQCKDQLRLEIQKTLNKGNKHNVSQLKNKEASLSIQISKQTLNSFTTDVAVEQNSQAKGEDSSVSNSDSLKTS